MALPSSLSDLIKKMKDICLMPAQLEIRILQTAKDRRVPRNTILLKPGEVCDHLYYIEQGILCGHEMDEKERYCTQLMQEGDIVTSVDSFNNRTESKEQLMTIEDCILWTITYDELEAICQEFVEFRIIRQHFTDIYHNQSREMDAQSKRSPEKYYQYLKEKYPEIVVRVPLTILASFMGISRNTLYKIKDEYQ